MKNAFILIFSCTLFCLGCKKPLADPHASDYIYQSLKHELANAESKLAERSQQLDELVSKIPETDIQTADLKMLRAKIDFARQDIRKLEQKVRYWKIKLLSREELVRQKYLAAFNRGEEWDNSAETENFKKSKLRLTPRAPSSSSASKPDEDSNPQTPSETQTD